MIYKRSFLLGKRSYPIIEIVMHFGYRLNGFLSQFFGKHHFSRFADAEIKQISEIQLNSLHLLKGHGKSNKLQLVLQTFFLERLSYIRRFGGYNSPLFFDINAVYVSGKLYKINYAPEPLKYRRHGDTLSNSKCRRGSPLTRHHVLFRAACALHKSRALSSQKPFNIY